MTPATLQLTTTIPVMRPWLGTEESLAAADAVASEWVAQGPRVARFEAALAAEVGAPHGIAVSSCTAGLHLALLAAGVGSGDEVIVPSLSFIATANVVRYCGARPVFADIERDTLNLTPQSIAEVLTPRTRAVILVHQAGTPADIEAVHALCRPRGIEVIEDAACAIGSSYLGRPIGGHSDLVAFSFHPRKVITTGEGGMVLTGSSSRAALLRRLREHGMSMSAADRHQAASVVLEEYPHLGFNYRMTDIQAAIGLVQLGRLEAIVARRRELAERYQEAFSDLDGLITAADPRRGQTGFLQELMWEGISARRGIMAAHLQPAYADVTAGPLPVTEEVAYRSIILPLFHTMTPAEQERVIDAVRRQLMGLAG